MRGLMIYSNNMEDVEALATRALLVRAEFEIDTVTFEKSKTITTAFNQKVVCDYFIDEIHLDHYDFLIIPGGKYVSLVIDQDYEIKKLIQYFYEQNKYLCAICAAPRFLGQLGLLDDIRFTAYKGCEIDMPKGQYLPYKKALTDHKIITARSAGSVYEFVYEIICELKNKKQADLLLENILF